MRFLGMIRLWVNGEDYGTIEDHIARLFTALHRLQYPDERIHAEPAEDGEPVFLTDPLAVPLDRRLGLRSLRRP